jgi:hypothetical protein
MHRWDDKWGVRALANETLASKCGDWRSVSRPINWSPWDQIGHYPIAREKWLLMKPERYGVRGEILEEASGTWDVNENTAS